MLGLLKVPLSIISLSILVFCLGRCTREKDEKTKTKINSVISNLNSPINTSNSETATFALGCFWAPDAIFGSIKGVIRTRVGYAGGTTENPTYYNLGDYTETIQIDYDPNKISFKQLLDIFWKSHDPTSLPWKRQYMSIIFYHTAEQKRLAEETKAVLSDMVREKVYTEIIPFKEFYLAEDYHQKYHLRQNSELMDIFRELYSDEDDFISSTEAARINGYIAGYGKLESLLNELDSLDIPPEARQTVIEIIKAMKRKRNSYP